MKDITFYCVWSLRFCLKYGKMSKLYKSSATSLNPNCCFRSLCEEVFQKYSEYERIEKFSRPKVLRLLEILRIFRPPMSNKPTTHPESLEASDVPSAVLSEDIVTEAPTTQPTGSTQSSESSDPNPPLLRQPTAQPLHPTRRRRPDFPNRHHRVREDAHQLCGIIFTERRTTAKLLYHLLKVLKNLIVLLHTVSLIRSLSRMQVDVIPIWLT